MHEHKMAEYWAQAEVCTAKAESTKDPCSKQLWIQMAHDWIALAEQLGVEADQQNRYHIR